MPEEIAYKPQGARSGTGSESVLRYLVEDLRARGAQPAARALPTDPKLDEALPLGALSTFSDVGRQ